MIHGDECLITDTQLRMPIANQTEITDFYRENPQFWFPVSDADRNTADSVIYHTFSHRITFETMETRIGDQTIYGQIIFLDQFLRHFQRYLLAHPSIGVTVTEDDVYKARRYCMELARDNFSLIAHNADEFECVFTLMPFKHCKEYSTIFAFLHDLWLPQHANIHVTDRHEQVGIQRFPLLQRFYQDTYTKCYDATYVESGIIYEFPDLENVDVEREQAICDYYDPAYIKDATWCAPIKAYVTENKRDTLLKPLKALKSPILVSLSGGVDSMVLVSLLSQIQQGSVYAIHIAYGNRAEADDECRFLRNYCHRIGVPLFVYHIEYIRRGNCDRAFYETTTRNIRFAVYKHIVKRLSELHAPVPMETIPICLGHIADDMVENVWTNLARGVHLDNLKKMDSDNICQGVRIVRPFLYTEKIDIYAVSKMLRIPYLKNTTPEWSNRGKFRNDFYAATHRQFGKEVDRTILCVADTIAKRTGIIQRLVCKPVLDSFRAVDVEPNNSRDIYECDITVAVEADLDLHMWDTLITQICYDYLKTKKISVKSIAEFYNRITRLATTSKSELKDLVKGRWEHIAWFMHLKNTVGINLVIRQLNTYILQFIVKKY